MLFDNLRHVMVSLYDIKLGPPIKEENFHDIPLLVYRKNYKKTEVSTTANKNICARNAEGNLLKISVSEEKKIDSQRVSRLVRKALSFSKSLENYTKAVWNFVHH